MEDDKYKQKIEDWLNSLKDEELICFNCKAPAHGIIAIDDFSWGPYIICDVCKLNADSLIKFLSQDFPDAVH
jgi:hypothetical protein